MSNKKSKAKGPAARKDEQEQNEGGTPELVAVFGRQLQWQFELIYLDEWVIVQCAHIKHAKGSARYERGEQMTAEPLVEQLAKPAISFVVRMPRAWFTDENQIKSWFTTVCDAFDANLYGILTFEIQHHLHDLTRFFLDRAGIHKADKNQIIDDHIEGQPGVPGEIGTRAFLRILLAARGPNNESPANEFNLPDLIRVALRNLHPSRLFTYEGVNDYLKTHHPDYSAASGDSFRKRCAACEIDFVALVREERAQRKAEN